MPLLRGKKNIGRNIKTEMSHGKKHNQAVVYLAGLVDGDGCFNISKCRTSYIPRIMIVNTNKEIMDWLVDNFGGDVNKTSVRNQPKWKPRYTWRISSRKALDLAYEMVDYLIIKRKVAIAFCTWRANQDVFKPKDRKEGYDYLNEKIKEYNQKGIYAIN